MRLALLLFALLGAACSAAGCRDLPNVAIETSERPSTRALLQVAPPPPPNVCFSKGDCKPVPSPRKCPDGSIPFPNAANPQKCLGQCPEGTAPVPNTSFCAAKCPEGFQPAFFDGGKLFCVRCPCDGGVWVPGPPTAPRSGYCALPCPTGTFPYPGPPAVCCDKECPKTTAGQPTFFASLGPPVTCRTAAAPGTPPVTIETDLVCKERERCQGDPVFESVTAVPRPFTLPVCIPGPPAGLLFPAPNGKCWTCPCQGSFPYVSISPPPAKVQCSAPVCPAGYTACGPYCIKNEVAPLFGTNCLAILSNFPCIPNCPTATAPAGGDGGNGGPVNPVQ